MRRHISIAVITGIFAVLFSSSAFAQSGSLYGLSLDESAILVRVANLRSEGAASLRLGSSRLIAQEPGDVTAYLAVAADLYILRYQGENLEFIPRQGTIYTIVAGDSDLILLEDQAHDDPLRCQLYVYVQTAAGVTGTPLSLKTADGSTALLENIAPGSSAAIAVNPVAIELALFDDTGRKVSADFDPMMARGASIAIAARLVAGDRAEVTTRVAEIQVR
jgi:alginate O-acetyltransferase complex protein AlgF